MKAIWTTRSERNAASEAYARARLSHTWAENRLARADEDIEGNVTLGVVRRFRPYLARYRGTVVISMICMLLYTALNLANPLLIGIAIDNFIHPHDLADLPGLAVISLILLGVNVAMWQAQYWQVWTMSWAGEQMLYRLAADMYVHLQKLSLSFYDHTQIGRVMSRLQSDIDVLESMLSSGLLSMLSSVIALVGIIGIMIALNVRPGPAGVHRAAAHVHHRRLLAALRPALLPPHARRHLARQLDLAGEPLRHARHPEHGARGPQRR